jgi:hypothetical protein
MAAAMLASCQDASAPGARLTITPDQVELTIGGTRQLTAIGAAGQVSWTTGNPAVADVVARTGFVTATGRGATTITAASGPATATAHVTVLAPPTIALSAAALDFAMLVGGAAPSGQVVAVTNAGDGVLADITLGATEYGVGQPTGWLSVAASGGTAPVTLTFNVQPGSLSHGTYTATVPVLSSGVVNSPQHVAVTFRVQRPAAIAVNPDALALTGIPGVTVTGSVAVTNAGDLPLTGLTHTVSYAAGAADWLSGSLSATTAPATLQLTANTTGLDPATYTASVRIAAGTAGVEPRDVPVTLVVTTGPTLQLSQTTVEVSATYGSDPDPVQIAVTNSGGGTVSGLSLGTISYGGGPTGWLTAVLSGPTAPATLTLSIAAQQLASGSYTAMLPVNSESADNSPVTLTVNLTVGPLPVIAVSPSAVFFGTWAGAARPGPQVVQVTNAQEGALTGLSASVQYTSGTTGWLDHALSSSSAPAQLALQPNVTSLPVGEHHALVTIESSMPGVAPRTVDVVYIVQSFSVHVYPYFGTAGCTGCHGSTLPPDWSGSALQVYQQLLGYIEPGDAAGSLVICKAFGSCDHGGGKFNDVDGFAGALGSWINAGAPFQ